MAHQQVEFRDRAIYLDDVLVIADLHIGKIMTSNVDLPVGEGLDMIDRFEALCEHYEPREVVVAGDLLHSFDSVPRMVEETLGSLEAVADTFDIEITVTAGNHDTMLDVVWSGQTTPEFNVGETVICHGHVEPQTDAKQYIIGHDHPTITIEGQNHPCYLHSRGAYRGSEVLMLPAFNRLVTGVTINEMSGGDFMSPLISTANSLAPIIWDTTGREVLEFPPLGEFRHKL